jgi:predicted RNA binding protein YcfA (HicA-like mRNA interferase family)
MPLGSWQGRIRGVRERNRRRPTSALSSTVWDWAKFKNGYNERIVEDAPVAKVETNTRKVIDRLKAEGWVDIGGGGHDRFVHAVKPATMIPVLRHRELSPGVARSIAKAAG